MAFFKKGIGWARVAGIALIIPISCSREPKFSAEIENQLKIHPEINPQLSQSILTVLQQTSALHPGMTRADLSKFYAPEPGLSSRELEIYAYRKCPEIKITVTFKPSDNAAPSQSYDNNRDIIVKIQGPYLGYARFVG